MVSGLHHTCSMTLFSTPQGSQKTPTSTQKSNITDSNGHHFRSSVKGGEPQQCLCDNFQLNHHIIHQPQLEASMPSVVNHQHSVQLGGSQASFLIEQHPGKQSTEGARSQGNAAVSGVILDNPGSIRHSSIPLQASRPAVGLLYAAGQDCSVVQHFWCYQTWTTPLRRPCMCSHFGYAFLENNSSLQLSNMVFSHNNIVDKPLALKLCQKGSELEVTLVALKIMTSLC